MAAKNTFQPPLNVIRADDFVEYFLFFNEIGDVNANEEVKEVLKEKLLRVRSIVSKYTEKIIWHKDPFNVNVRDGTDDNLVAGTGSKSDGEVLQPHLYGVVHFGDNIEDEWFVVFLLLQLSQEIEGLIVRVADSDGEFLLIEAANFLPDWASPDVCENCVYLFRGAVHLVTPVNSQAMSVTQAVSRIRSSQDETRAEDAVQQAVMARTQGYPDKITQLLHRTTAIVPVAVAALLQKRPQLVAPTVQAFCNRDPLDMKACRAMRFFPPEVCVATSVMMTRCLYAMLAHQKFTPDRRTGWVVLPPSDPQYLASNIGVKLACGFEILVSEAKKTGSERGWQLYLNSLESKGYFMDLLEGSKEHTALLAKAQDYYKENKQLINEKPTTGHEIVELMDHLEYDVQQLKKAENNLPMPDSDQWLLLDPTDVDAMLEQRYGCPGNDNDERTIASHLTQFITHVSGLDGAEFPPQESETPPVRPQRGIKKKVANTSSSDMTGAINFDSEAFSCAVGNILDLVVPEDRWDSDDSDMSSYENEADMELGQVKATPDELKQYMDQMDRELSKTTLGQSFHRRDDGFDDVEDFTPVDIDMNALKNILESYKSELGGAGPASNLLGPMGVQLQPPSHAGEGED